VVCIFCGNPKLSREHIYSRAWIERLVPDAESHTNWLSRDFEGDPVATWASSEADVVVRCVCRECNSGWMNDLDRTAEPIVNELARGENRVRVEGGALQVFATWAVKMALVMECALTPMVLAQETRQHFSRERKPPPEFRVWVATMEGYEAETRTTPMTLVDAPEPGASVQAYLATFRMLHLVVEVLAPLRANVQPEPDNWARERVQLAWPRDQTLEWPLFPKERWLRSEDDYLRLVQSFRTYRAVEGGGRESA
jgi:hypothetical protein